MPQTIQITEPPGYPDMIRLVRNNLKILTDYSGMQKEVYMPGVPCITLRENTANWVKILTGAD